MAVSTVHHFVITPHVGVGPIRFGMHKDEVSHAFTYVYTSFFKSSDNKVRADDCEVVGLIIHYDDNSLVNFIEVYKAEYATVTLELFGKDVTDISIRKLVSLLGVNKVPAEQVDCGYQFPAAGLSTYNSNIESEDDLVETIGVGL